MSEKLITKCPVCGSEDIEQDFKYPEFSISSTIIGSGASGKRDGSHCNNCGCKFVFNHLSEIDYRKGKNYEF